MSEPIDTTRRWLRVQEAAHHAGFAEAAFMAMVKSGEVPSHVNERGVTYLYADEIDEWLAEPERANHRDHRRARGR